MTEALLALLNAAKPFVHERDKGWGIVDELCETAPLLDALEEAIEQAEAALKGGK